MNPGKFSIHLKTKGHVLWVEMLVFIVALALSLVLFMKEALLPFSPLPMLAVAAWIILPRLGSRSDQVILLAFFILCFFIDDIAQGPWNDVDSITKDLGILLFRSFGITGFEAFTIGFCFLCFVITKREEKKAWLGYGLLPLLFVASLVLTTGIIGVLFGLISGGTLQTGLIQIRVFYLLPLWTFIGFVVMRDELFFRKIFFWLTVLMVFKSLQAIFIWSTNRGALAEMEYIYEHYFSAYLVVAMLHLLQYAWRRPEGLIKLISLLSFGAALFAYILNARRTSYVGIPFALMALPFFLPQSIMKHYGRLIVTSLLLLGTITVATWPLPISVGALYRSFGQESGQGGPSYRDLENANMLREVSRHPLTGMGYGKEFEEFYPMPSVATRYPRYKMVPHNALLSAWCYGGPLTIAGVSLIFIFMFGLAGRLIYDEDMVGYRYIGLFCLFYFMQFFSYVFGDIGLTVNKNQLLGGLFLGGCYRLYQMRKRE